MTSRAKTYVVGLSVVVLGLAWAAWLVNIPGPVVALGVILVFAIGITKLRRRRKNVDELTVDKSLQDSDLKG